MIMVYQTFIVWKIHSELGEGVDRVDAVNRTIGGGLKKITGKTFALPGLLRPSSALKGRALGDVLDIAE